MDAVDLSAVITVGDKITSPVTSGTIDGGLEDATVVTMDEDVATIMAVGDLVSGPGCPVCDAGGSDDACLVTVVGTGGNAKRFTISGAQNFTDDGDLNFSSKVNRSHTTVEVVETDSTATDFTMSQAIQFRDNQPLTFTPRKNHQWAVDNIEGITKGLELLPGTNVTANSITDDYEDSITIFEGTEDEEKIIQDRRDFKDTKGKTPTVTKGLITTQAGNIIFSEQQVLAFGGATQKLLGYGIENILSAYNYDVRVTDLNISLTPIKTTTTSAVSASATVPVASVNGILPNVSEMSGIGIEAGKADPTVTARSATSGAGNLTLSVAQTLESGIEFTFPKAGQVAVVTGNIEILKAGTANQTIYLDMEKLLSIT